MSNIMQFLRSTTTGAVPPTKVAPGEPVVILDQVGKVDFYIGDSAGTPILVSTPPTPIGGVEMDYVWDADIIISDPGSGAIKLDGDQDPAGALPGTAISVNYTTKNGNNFEQIWKIVKAGDYLGLFEQGGGGGAGGEIFYFLVSGVTDNVTWMQIDGEVAFYGGNDIDNSRPVSVFLVPDPTFAAGDVYTAPDADQNLIQPTADHPALRLLRTAGQTSNTLALFDELSNYVAGMHVSGTTGGPDLTVTMSGFTIDAGVFLSMAITDAGLTSTLTIDGGRGPYDIDWGDAGTDIGVAAGAHPHTYAAPGAFTVTTTDAAGTVQSAIANPV